MLDREEERRELLEKIEELIQRKQYKELRALLLPLEAADIAQLADDLDDEKTLPLLFRLLPKEQAAEVFVELDSDQQELLIRGFSNTELKEVLDELYLDDTVDIVEEMPANMVKQLVKHSQDADRTEPTHIVEIKNGTELGKTAKGYIDNGQLIPDELMIDILASVYDSFGTLNDKPCIIYISARRLRSASLFLISKTDEPVKIRFRDGCMS